MKNKTHSSGWVVVVVSLLSLLVCKAPTWAEAQGNTTEDPEIQLNFPENAPLKTFIAFVSTRLNLNIVYDDQLVDQSITFKAPSTVRESALLSVLGVVLKSKGLALQATDLPGLYRIVSTNEIASSALMATSSTQYAQGAGGAVTRVFVLRHAGVGAVRDLVQRFLTEPGGSVEIVADRSLVVVTDFTSNITRIAQLIDLMDTPDAEPVVQAVTVRSGEAKELLQAVEPLIKTQAVVGQPLGASVQITSDARTNQLIVRGPVKEVSRVVGLIVSLDEPPKSARQVYRPSYTTPEQLDTLIKKTLDPQAVKRGYRAAVNSETGMLVVTAPEEIHKQIKALLKEIDVLPEQQQQPVRFYKLTNTIAEDVLNTIRSLEGASGYGSFAGESQATGLPVGEAGPAIAAPVYSAPGGTGSGPQSLPPGAGISSQLPPPGSPPGSFPGSFPGSDGSLGSGAGIYATGPQSEGSVTSSHTGAIIAADNNTNSIIVIAPPVVQQYYEQIIKKIDQRRPQVMIETTIVSLDTSDGFTLGVEISANGGLAHGKIFSFSSFGLSEVDKKDGRLSPIPGLGGNFALLSPEVADIVVRALSTNSRARLVSMPRILVNDNEQGTLESVAREPYASINASNTVSTTSLGGFAEAGTTIDVRPHISNGDYLQLEYGVELSSFTGKRDESLPPPSQQNRVTSRVTIPDGHTIVVGGLNRSDYRQSVNSVPLLNQIPVLKEIFSSTKEDTINTTLFVFIRPTILRDDQFRDLKYLSEIDVGQAGVSSDLPASQPILMEPSL